MSRARTVLTLGLFGIGIVLGVLTQVVTRPVPPVNPYPSLTQAAEPRASAIVADAIRRDDANLLATTITDADLLQQLQQAIQPLVEVSEVDFTGAVEKDGTTLAAYVAKGKTNQGQKFIVGFVLSVQANQVVGVN